jgi:hypothetical protein
VTAIVVVVLLAVLGVPATSQAETLFRVDRLAVYDGAGRLVGTVAAPNVASFEPTLAAATVAFRTETGRLVSVLVTQDRLFGDADLHFERANCTGDPLLPRSTRSIDDLFTASAVVGPRRTVYVQTGRFRSVVSRSRWDTDGSCVGGFEQEQELAPASTAGIDLADYFTPPFRLRAVAGDAVPRGPSTDALAPTDGLVVFDGTGKRLGATSHGVVIATAFVTGSKRIVPVRLHGDTISTDEVYFESANCSGTPFLANSNDALARPTAVLGPRWAVWARNGIHRERIMRSRGQPGGPCIEAPADGWVVSAASLVSLDLELADYFTPPFTVRAGRETRPLGSLD